METTDKGEQDIPFLSLSNTPNVSFSELALLCAEYLSLSACNAVDRVKSCADSIIINAHTQWVEAIVHESMVSMRRNLRNELGIRRQTDVSSSIAQLGTTDDTISTSESLLSRAAEPTNNTCHTAAGYKAHWKVTLIELDDADTGSKVQEKLLIPCRISTALQDFMFSCNHHANYTMLSADTMQRLPVCLTFIPAAAGAAGALSDNSQASQGINHGRLVDSVSSSMRSHAIRSGLSIYTDLVKSNIFTELTENAIEDVALQLVFDLMVCVQATTELSSVAQANGDQALMEAMSIITKELRACIIQWESFTDAVNYQLIRPALTESALDYSKKVSLLNPLFFPKSANSLARSSDSGSMSMAPPLLPSGSNQKQTQQPSAYLSPTSARFGLLPLPVSTQSILTGSHSSQNNQTSRGHSRNAVPFATPDSKGDRTKTGAVSSGESALNQLQQQSQSAAGSLRKGIMTGLGNLLGGTVGANDK